MTADNRVTHYAVAQARHSALDSLDYFPTPPWATRALVEFLASRSLWPLADASLWEPAAGGRHMSLIFAETFRVVAATDVHDYGGLDGIGSFVGVGPDVASCPFAAGADWIATNPPFKLALEFFVRVFAEATHGVALLLRSAWMEGVERYETIFSRHPPIILQFAERVPMVAGRWDPDATTATPYAWFIWPKGPGWTMPANGGSVHWVPPGARKRLTHVDDVARFAGERAIDAVELFDGLNISIRAPP
ncbi:MAG: hypothetical protein P4L82_11990 [Ancalomicrobiaceae bacterium]|nr:hypothetical protein [Ancalomicrobiaceae bacterium]